MEKRDKTLKGSEASPYNDAGSEERNHAEVLSEVSQIEGIHYLEEV